MMARLPAGTVLRVERIDYVPTLDTAAIVPRAIIVSGSERGRKVNLGGISIEVPGPDYPSPPTPDLEVVSILATK